VCAIILRGHRHVPGPVPAALGAVVLDNVPRLRVGLVGDLIKSFIKRRLGLDRGSKSPFLMDQLDFVAGAWLVTIPIFYGWFFRVFGMFNIIIVLVMAPVLHRAVNIIGYKLGAKKEPW